MGERVYAMDCRFPVMVCGMAETKNPSTQKGERKLSIFDLNNPTRPIRVRRRAVACVLLACLVRHGC